MVLLTVSHVSSKNKLKLFCLEDLICQVWECSLDFQEASTGFDNIPRKLQRKIPLFDEKSFSCSLSSFANIPVCCGFCFTWLLIRKLRALLRRNKTAMSPLGESCNLEMTLFTRLSIHCRWCVHKEKKLKGDRKEDKAVKFSSEI